MLLLTNGTIATMDPARPLAEAAVVDGAYFAYVGGRSDALDFVRRFSGGTWETLDLQGRFLMPGFNDSHLHFIHYVKTKLSVDLFGCASLGEALDRLRRGLEGWETGSGRWLLGEGWNQEYFTDEKRFPTCRDLDQVSREHPILILRSCFHVGVLNSKAMELLHIDRDTVGRYGVFAEVDETGAPTGVIKENVLDDIKAGIPSVGLAPLLEQVAQSQYDLLAEGLTSIQSDDFKYAPEEKPYALMDGLRDMAERGGLKLRLAEQALLTEPETLEEFFQRGGAEFGGGSRFRISTVKILADGSLGARTAFLQEPYADDPATCGLPIYPEQEQLDRLVLAAHRHNMPAAIHAIGDGAAEMVLRAFQRAREEMPWLRPRHGMVHCQILTEEQLRRMAELEVTAFVQPVFINGDMHIAPDRLGAARLPHSYAWGEMERLGIHTAFGTDCPVERFHPLEGVYCAVTRRDLSGRGPFLPEQALTPWQALYAYTAGGAYASGEEDIKGRIRPGMLADFILVDRDLLSCPPEELLSARVLRTYVGGECVYRHPSC